MKAQNDRLVFKCEREVGLLLALIALFNREKALVLSNLDYLVLCESFIQERLV